MATQSAQVGNLYVLKLAGIARVDPDAVRRDVRALGHRCGEAPVVVLLWPEPAQRLDTESRRRAIELAEGLLPLCRKLLLIVDGSGFRGALARSSMTALVLLSWRHESLAIIDDVDEALALVGPELSVGPRAVAEVLTAVGVEVPANLAERLWPQASSTWPRVSINPKSPSFSMR